MCVTRSGPDVRSLRRSRDSRREVAFSNQMRRLIALLFLLVLLPAAPAHAGPGEIGIADDRILMPGGAVADRAVAEWSAMGVDTVRIFALWSRIAPARRPVGFDADDPSERSYQWFYLDNAV